MTVEKHTFPSARGETLAARFDRPDGTPRAYALFAHCFTCTKDFIAARRIAANLSRLGIAVLRFDFTGLGASDGDFANTSFVSNVDDLVAAAEYMASRGEAPSILIGHSLGGAAVLAAAEHIESVKGIATIGAPADVSHVLHHFASDIETIEANGQAEVTLGGRAFTIGKAFVDAARENKLTESLGRVRADIMIMHGPLDATVGIDNATRLFTAARHPKSFVSLDKADHLLTGEDDARFAGEMIAAWATRFLPDDIPLDADAVEHVRVAETGNGKFQNTVLAGRHRMFADEPESVGGADSGPSPYDFLSAALGACTSMTLRMYADFKKLKLGAVTVDVAHSKIHAKDCVECSQEMQAQGGKIDRFERVISIDGDIPSELAEKIEEIAGKCPVHRTLEGKATVVTKVS